MQTDTAGVIPSRPRMLAMFVGTVSDLEGVLQVLNALNALNRSGTFALIQGAVLQGTTNNGGKLYVDSTAPTTNNG